jgi:hypothetical protein
VNDPNFTVERAPSSSVKGPLDESSDRHFAMGPCRMSAGGVLLLALAGKQKAQAGVEHTPLTLHVM